MSFDGSDGCDRLRCRWWQTDLQRRAARIHAQTTTRRLSHSAKDAQHETRESKQESEAAAVHEKGTKEEREETGPEPSAPEGVPEANIQVEEVEDFGAALASYESGLKALKEGEVVAGKVLKVLEKDVIVDIGYKSEGVISLDEFHGTQINVGDRVDVLLE